MCVYVYHILFTYCPLRIAYGLLPIAYCLLPIPLLPIAYRLPPNAYCVLPIASCLWPIAYGLLPMVHCPLQYHLVAHGARGTHNCHHWQPTATGRFKIRRAAELENLGATT